MKLSKSVNEYKTQSPGARATILMLENGHSLAPGQSLRFVYTIGKPGVWADGCGDINLALVDKKKYY